MQVKRVKIVVEPDRSLILRSYSRNLTRFLKERYWKKSSILFQVPTHPRKVLNGKSTWELWKKEKPNLSFTKIFGERVYFISNRTRTDSSHCGMYTLSVGSS